MDKAELSACLEQADSKEAGALLRSALRNKMREALMEILEEEVQGLCGSSHSRDSKSDYYRAGSSPAKVKLGDQEHAIRRPRVGKSLGDKGQGSYRRDAGAGPVRSRYSGRDARRNLSLRGLAQRGCHRNR